VTHEPPLVDWLLVVLSLATAVSCLVRSQDREEAVMGAGMAVMAVPASVLGPQWWVAPVFAAVYAAAALRAMVPGGACQGHRVHHVVCSAAMVYMASAMAGWGARGHGDGMRMGSGVPAATGLLALYFAVYVVRAGVRLVLVPAPVAAAPGAGDPAGPPLRLRHSREVADACRVSMALGMLTMLLLM
jgi:hypothetical protein